jgi:heterodisulfide reductase subunit C
MVVLANFTSRRTHLKPFLLPPCTVSLTFQFSTSLLSLPELKGIIVEYTSQHPSAAHHLYWQTALLYVFNAIVKDQSDPQWRFYFWLCIHCYSKLFLCYLAVEDFVQSLLAIAVKYGAISRKDARSVMQEGFYKDGKEKRERRRREELVGNRRGTYKLDLDLAVRDRDAADVSALIARFEDMAMFEEFTRLDESESSEGGNE